MRPRALARRGGRPRIFEPGTAFPYDPGSARPDAWYPWAPGPAHKVVVVTDAAGRLVGIVSLAISIARPLIKLKKP